MCVNFTNLNKHSPKDYYALPFIEQNVVDATGYEVLSFLDLYKGYHQVLMGLADTEKTTFVIDWGVFADKKMPFGLKNVGTPTNVLSTESFGDRLGETWMCMSMTL